MIGALLPTSKRITTTTFLDKAEVAVAQFGTIYINQLKGLHVGNFFSLPGGCSYNGRRWERHEC